MQTLDVNDPGLPDLQFVLMVLALCSSELETVNVPESLRVSLFDRCWAMLHDEPPPTSKEERVLDLREGHELALQAMVDVIRRTLNDRRITVLRWDHPPSPPSQKSTLEALPLVERVQRLYPASSDSPDAASERP